MTGPTPASGPAAPLAPEECAAFGQQARALLYTLDSRPLADVDPATVRECTALFLEAYPKLYAVPAVAPEHLALHEEALAAIQKRLSGLDVPHDVLFSYVLEFQVTAAVLYTDPCPPLAALHKNPRLPVFHITSKTFRMHQLEIPAAFDPDKLQATANCIVEDIGYALVWLQMLSSHWMLLLHDPDMFSPTRATAIAHALARIVQLRPALWSLAIPVLCRLAAAMAQRDATSPALRAPSVRYAVRSALLLLIRLPKAGRWRPQLQAAAEALTATFAGSQLLSSNQEEALKSYLHRAAREEAQDRKRERAEAAAAAATEGPKRPRLSLPLTPAEPEADDSLLATPVPGTPTTDADDFPVALADEEGPAMGAEAKPAGAAPPEPPVVPYAVQCLLATLKHVDVRGLRLQHKEGVRRILQQMAAMYDAEVRGRKA